MKITFILVLATLSAAMTTALPGLAQEHAMLVRPPDSVDASSGGAAAAATTSVLLAAQPADTKFDRWVDVNDLSFSFRYRKEVANDDFKYFGNGQQKSLIDGRFKFDSHGKYAVNFRVSSGRTFNWAFTDEIGDDFGKLSTSPRAFGALSPVQIQRVLAAAAADPDGAATVISRGWGMNFRQLYFSAAPVKQIALEYGSLYIDRGESTEATTYDDDGYISGERVRILDSKHLFVDQMSFTNAYEGDIDTPSFFKRGERLKEANYRQVLATKQFGKRFNTSADYTFDKGTHTTREAIVAKLPEIKAIDSIRLELYQRLNDHVLFGETYHAHQGFAVTGTKTFRKRFQLDGGYAHIDEDYGVLTGSRILSAIGFSMNGDSFLTGSRAFTRANWKVAPGIIMYGYYTHTTSPAPPANLLLNKEGLNGGLTIDLKGLLTKARVM